LLRRRSNPGRLAPRCFVFAVNSDYKTDSTVEENLQRFTKENNAHIHALIVLNKDWLFKQRDFEETPQFDFTKDQPFERFCIACWMASRAYTWATPTLSGTRGLARGRAPCHAARRRSRQGRRVR
jgi:hypothetical protein